MGSNTSDAFHRLGHFFAYYLAEKIRLRLRIAEEEAHRFRRRFGYAAKAICADLGLVSLVVRDTLSLLDSDSLGELLLR